MILVIAGRLRKVEFSCVSCLIVLILEKLALAESFVVSLNLAPESPINRPRHLQFDLNARGRKHTKREKRSNRNTVEHDDSVESSSTSTVYDVKRQRRATTRDSHARPSKTKKVNINIPISSGHTTIFAFEVDDNEWWDLSGNHNPFGGRCWPSSIAVAEYLASFASLDGWNILELGCGTGIPSITAAACGANVIATDVSLLSLELVSKGWTETKTKQKDSGGNESVGALATKPFDLFSSAPLPLTELSSSDSQSLVLAGSLMYEEDLAYILASRLAEAVKKWDACVIVGDCDSGERDNGRRIFMTELEKLLPKETCRQWKDVTVSSSELHWRLKGVKLLVLNYRDQTPS